MTHKLEINRMSVTADAAVVFVASLDQQIEELDAALTLTKQVRGTVARAFGIDRRDGATDLQKLLDASTRSIHEIEIETQDALERELEIRRGDQS